ncbi:Hsp33 family molecular chaperone HslO, partial [Klebsiella pneumoniae]|uniref:Hsp33 family molecular chaperone HslO n=1 Tax=Klebsiella pneumoniae TaxID=573 RepID=UPI0021759771
RNSNLALIETVRDWLKGQGVEAWLAHNPERTKANLFATLPAQDGNLDDFDHLVQLTNTVKSEELFGLPANEVLYRLYHQEEVTLYEPQDVQFRCTCSRQRCADA